MFAAGFGRGCCPVLGGASWKLQLVMLLDILKIATTFLVTCSLETKELAIPGLVLSSVLLCLWTALLVRLAFAGDASLVWAWRYIRATQCLAPLEIGFLLRIEVSPEGSGLPGWLKAAQFAFPIADSSVKALGHLSQLECLRRTSSDKARRLPPASASASISSARCWAREARVAEAVPKEDQSFDTQCEEDGSSVAWQSALSQGSQRNEKDATPISEAARADEALVILEQALCAWRSYRSQSEDRGSTAAPTEATDASTRSVRHAEDLSPSSPAPPSISL